MRQKISLIIIEAKIVWKFCKGLREHAMRILSYEKKKMTSLTDEENRSYKKQKVCYICEKEFTTDDDKKKYHKVRHHCH